MNCHEFREHVIETPRRRAGHERGSPSYDHATECAACAAWLAAEENLAASFDVLKEQDDRLQAPPAIEAALIEEFQKLHQSSLPAGTGPVAVPAAAPAAVRIRGFRGRWWIGAAAAALALAAWFGLGERRLGPPPNSIALSLPDAPEPAPPPESPGGQASDAPAVTAPATTPPAATARATEPIPPRAPRPEAAPAPGDSDRAASPPPRESPSELPEAVAVAERNRAAEEQREVVTEFVPLTYAGSAASARSQLVRVRLPSTALAYFGLPGAAASSSVEADVLLGEDGLAYAVRFVRPAKVSLSASDRADPRTLERY